jgi:hypothetical protein
MVSGLVWKSMIAVLEADVTVDGETIAYRLELLELVPVARARLSVTPAGILLNVSRICEELSTGAPELLSCVAVLQHAAQPSVRINAPWALATVPLVKIVAVPEAGLLILPAIVELPGARPMAMPEMPAFKLATTVPEFGDPRM